MTAKVTNERFGIFVVQSGSPLMHFPRLRPRRVKRLWAACLVERRPMWRSPRAMLRSVRTKGSWAVSWHHLRSWSKQGITCCGSVATIQPCWDLGQLATEDSWHQWLGSQRTVTGWEVGKSGPAMRISYSSYAVCLDVTCHVCHECHECNVCNTWNVSNMSDVANVFNVSSVIYVMQRGVM